MPTSGDICCNKSQLDSSSLRKKRLSFKKRSSSMKETKVGSLDLYNDIDIYGEEETRSDKLSTKPSASDYNVDVFPAEATGLLRLLPWESVSEQANENESVGKLKSNSAKKLRRISSVKEYTSPRLTFLDHPLHSASFSPFSGHSLQNSIVNPSGSHSTVSRTLSAPTANSSERKLTQSLRKRYNIFGHKSITSSPSMSSTVSSRSNTKDIKVPSPDRFFSMYHAVYKGVSELISVNTAELNVLQVRKKEASVLNAAQAYDSDKLIKHLERVIKKLQFHQTQLDEVFEAYTLQQRYIEGAKKLKAALSSSRVSRRAAMLYIKADIARCTETLCTLEQEVTGLLGRFHFEMNGLLGFARLRAGDQYEVVVRYGSQKWRIKGAVKSSVDQTWDTPRRTMQPLLTEFINIKVMEVKMLGKHSTIGSISCETKDLFKVDPQDLIVDLNDTATLKLSLKVRWSPYDGYESPTNACSGKASIPAITARLRTKSAVTRPISDHYFPTKSRSKTSSRPLSVVYLCSTNDNNSNNKATLKISAPISTENNAFGHTSIEPTDGNSHEATTTEVQKPDISTLCVQSEEDAFIAAISKNAQLATNADTKEEVHKILEEKQTIKKNSFHEMSISQKLMSAATEVNLQLDDYRGRYAELWRLESIVLELLDKLKVDEEEYVLTDGFHVLANDVNGGPASSRVLENYENGKIPTTGNITCDEALIPHLSLVQYLLKDIGAYGPMKVRELLALDKLQKQGETLARILNIADSGEEISFDDMSEFDKRRTLLEMWRSCCDGNTSFCVSAKTLRLELKSAFGTEVRNKHPDVADKIFPELVKRIVGRPDLSDVEGESVTLFHLSDYVNDAADGENEDFEKLVDKLALEMFITSMLSSGIQHLVLVAIKRISSLLALRISNLRALSHLLLDSNRDVRTAAAAHLRHMATEKLLREKAILAYAELLESSTKRDRQCACIAIGFLAAEECIPQLAYVYHSDVDLDVREAASNVLRSLGDEGEAALDHVSSTLLSQTMTQQVTLSNHARMGTAL